jgi:hypothetical protein
MSLTSSFGWTNTTDSTATVTPTAIGWSNYALVTDDPGKCVLKNLTCPIDQTEVISFLCQDIPTVITEEKNVNPPKVSGGRTITVKLEAKKRQTSSTDDTFIVDYPAVCSISWRFSKNQALTASDLLTLLKRAIGALQDASTDGYIIDELMMQQLNPKA